MPLARLVCALVGVLSFVVSIKAAPLAAERTKAITAEVNAAMDQYNTWFGAARADLIAERVYMAPCVNINETGGATALLTRDDIQKRFENYLKPLVADGYARSEWPIRNVCVLHDRAAIVSGAYTRYRKDGSVIGKYAGTYMFAKTDAGWRIVSWTAHDVSAIVRPSN